MMDDEKGIVTQSISDRELERRWKAVRKRMREEKTDFLVMQNDNEWLGGYVKWFTDVPARNAQPHTVIFPVDEEMTTITHGGKPPGDVGPPAWTLRGVKTRLTAPFFRSAAFTNTYDAELAVDVLKAKRNARIGILGKGTMSAAFYMHLVESLPGATFVDAADLVDDIKAAASGLLKAEVRETFIGYATIKEVFKVTGVGQVAGCLVTEGVARRSAGVRLLRDSVVIHEGTLKTLKRFKDEVKEVISGQECGMAFENYEDIRQGDVIEIFEREEVQRTLA